VTFEFRSVFTKEFKQLVKFKNS